MLLLIKIFLCYIFWLFLVNIIKIADFWNISLYPKILPDSFINCRGLERTGFLQGLLFAGARYFARVMVLHLPFKSRHFKPLFCFICFAVCHTAWDRLCSAMPNGSGQYTSWLVLTPPYFVILYFSVYVCMWENVVWRGRCLCTYRCMSLYRRCLSSCPGKKFLNEPEACWFGEAGWAKHSWDLFVSTPKHWCN